MKRNRSDVVSATEIATWAWCPESWRLESLGKRPENDAALARGKVLHNRIAAVEVWSRRAVTLGCVLLLLAIIVAILGYRVFGGQG